MSITLPRPLVNQLLQHAQQVEDKEVCGLISSRDGLPARHYPIQNVAPTPECRFAMDPKTQIDALREMREHGEELFAIYHSHPSSPAVPSTIDLQEAGYPEAVYLIISLNTKGVLEIRGFKIDGRVVKEIELEI